MTYIISYVRLKTYTKQACPLWKKDKIEHFQVSYSVTQLEFCEARLAIR